MNNSNGMFQVGFCYYNGIGVAIDKHKAFEHYQKSAEMNNSNGTFTTAICYYYGIGVEKNKDKFQEWNKKDPLPRFYCEDPKNGKCEYCKGDNTRPAWCMKCDPNITAHGWTSRNKDVDNCIRELQLRTFEYEDVIEWIPYDRLDDIKKIGEGGFGSVYSAIWLDGVRKINVNDDCHYVKARESPSMVALKTLASSKKNQHDVLKEFKNHVQCINYGSKLKIYGITQDTKTNEYLMVLQFADKGNLRRFLETDFRKLKWKSKLNQLKDIATDLKNIHNAGYVHADLHSGNILQNQHDEKKIQSYVADLGLSRKQDEHKLKEDIYGVLPYVAPEVFSGEQPFTQAADIYSFGIIMAEMSTGTRPFDGYKFDTNLAVRIYKGERPEFAPGTPECYIKLAKQCMDSVPQKRPDAHAVRDKIRRCYSKVQEEDTNEVKEEFLKADDIVKTISEEHPDHMYTSKLISIKMISNAIKDSFYNGST